MNLLSIKSREQFIEVINKKNKNYSSIESKIAEVFLERKEFHLIGYCNVCKDAVQFYGDWLYSDGITPNYRERLVCEKCCLNNRQRFIAYLTIKELEVLVSGPLNIFCYEAVTAFYKWLSGEYPTAIGSEFLGLNLPSGSLVNGIRHEDAMNLSFSNETMDLLISQDVFEHVPDITKSVSEVSRVLKSNGVILFSIPFHAGSIESKQRAIMCNGEIEYLVEPVYHGNPIDSNGSLVFWDIGWDIFDLFSKNGFDLEIIGCWSLEYGHIGGFPFVFKGTKK